MAFWTEITDPKRKFNFEVSISDDEGMMENYFAKTATKPSFTINAAEHNYLNHTFYYPGRLTWNDVTVTFVDPGGGDSASGSLAKLLANAGYNPPQNPEDNKTMSKSKACGALGGVIIRQLDENGALLDEWVLINAWVTEVNFGDLDYSSDDLVEVSCTFKYDFAKYLEPGAQIATHLFDPGTIG